MDSDRFDRLVRTLAGAGSRRGLLRRLAALPLGAMVAALVGHEPDAIAKDDDHGSTHRRKRRKARHRRRSGDDKENRKGKRKRKGKQNNKKVTVCHYGQTTTVSKSALPAHLAHGDTEGACSPPPDVSPPPRVPVVTYQCPQPGGIRSGTAGGGADFRFAQTFTPAQSGPLHQIQFELAKKASTGDFVVELLAVGADGKPTNTVLASVTFPNASIPGGDPSTVTATFSGPPLVAGTPYAAAISRPGATDQSEWVIREVLGGGCAGGPFEQTPIGTGSFDELPDDLVTSVTVLA